ncbi:hypothetical protein [Actinomadura rudentiformis]|uniref:Uncharacterized protein n=1 Tax=Actinomadura rudentiformis TaxID=359158 RepID=A0A6H9YY73_9ACTN|nr:hypothetical protein [Actinomadura rudentiformis]KAB2351473.1 hypothetical protein F8566_04335 [Actinomadura rudentiformis]
MSFDGPKHRGTRPDQSTPDSQRAVLLDELGRELVCACQELRVERVGLPTRLVVTKHGSEACEEVGCDFDAETGWWFVWLWGEQQPQRIGHVRDVQQVARSVASVMGIRPLKV